MRKSTLVSALLTTVAISGCPAQLVAIAAGLPATPGGSFRQERVWQLAASIQHIVIMIQENRSFDNFFATFPGADGTTYGCMEPSGSGSVIRRQFLVHRSGTYNCPPGDTAIPLKIGGLSSDSLGHEYFSFKKEYDNGPNGRIPVCEARAASRRDGTGGTYPYRYVNPKFIKPYWDLASNWVLADNVQHPGKQQLYRSSRFYCRRYARRR